MTHDDGQLEKRIEEKGREIYGHMADVSRSIFNPDWWSSHLMEWAMKDESFKVQLFRFVDVLPVLKTQKQVTQLLFE